MNLDPTVGKAGGSAAVGGVMGVANQVVENTTLILGYTPSEWTAFAAIAALSYSALCILKFVGLWDVSAGLVRKVVGKLFEALSKRFSNGTKEGE